MVLPLLLVEVFCRALSVLVAKKWSNFRLLLIFVEMLCWFWLVIGCQKIEVIFFFFWFLLGGSVRSGWFLGAKNLR